MTITKSFFDEKKYKYASDASAETFVIGADAKSVALGKNVSGDTIAIEGFAGDFKVKASNGKVTLIAYEDQGKSKPVAVQTITLSLAKGDSANLQFMDGSLVLSRAVGGGVTIGDQGVSGSLKYINDEDISGVKSDALINAALVGSGTYTLTAANSINEGETILFTLATDDVRPGSILTYTLNGVSGSDIDGPMTGTVVVDSSGMAVIGVKVAADQLTESIAENLTVTIGNNLASKTVAINDTSVGTTMFDLTAGTDRLLGTSGDDTFEAFLSQNPVAGGVSNSLSSADSINGGDGKDSLHAELVNEFIGGMPNDYDIDVQPRTTSVENVEFEARDWAWNFEMDGSNPIYGEDSPFDIVVDAKKMYGIEKIGSTYSDGDLVIENLTTLASDGVTKRNTSEMTITMDHTDNFNSDRDASDLTVYFDDNYLLSGQSFKDTLELRIANIYQLAENNAPLAGFATIDFSVGDKDITVDISGSTSYTQVLSKITTALATAGVEGVTAVIQDPREVFFSEDIAPYAAGQSAGTYTPILLVSTGAALTEGDINLSSNATDGNLVNTWVDSQPVTTPDPVSVNVELTKVGRGSDGGDLIIGAKSQYAGIPVMNVTVKGDESLPNSLGELGTTGSALTTVNIKSDSNTESYASLEIRNGFNQSSLEMVNAAEFKGDLTLGNQSNIDDLETLIATGGGDIDFHGDLTGNVDGNAYSYTTGDGEDHVVLNIDGDAVDTIGESLTVTTSGGNDHVDVDLDYDVSQRTMNILDNLHISTGADDDSVYISGMGRFHVTAGTGSDFVVVEGNEDGSGDYSSAGSWDVGTSTGLPQFADRVLYNADLTVSFAGFESTVRVTTTAANNYVATQLDINDAIERAIEANPELQRLVRVEYGTGKQFIDIYTEGIEGKNALKISLFQPTLGGADGEVDPGNAWDEIAQGMIQTGMVDDSSTVETAGEVETAFSDFDGSLKSDGSTGNGPLSPDFLHSFGDNWVSDTRDDLGDYMNYSVINMGTGTNDLVVLDANDYGANILEFGTDWTGGNNKVSVVNFFTDASGDNGASGGADGDYTADDSLLGTEVREVALHALDFTAWLNNTADASDNDNNWSTKPIAVTLSGDSIAGDDATANSVTVLSYNEDAGSTTIDFSALTAAQLVAVLNGAAATQGGLDDSDLGAIAAANLVGSTQNHIVMVENALNRGEFKVFHLTSTVNDKGGIDSVTSATNTLEDGDLKVGSGLLGTIDFGAGFDIRTAGNTSYDTPDPYYTNSGDFTEVNLVGSAAVNLNYDYWMND